MRTWLKLMISLVALSGCASPSIMLSYPESSNPSGSRADDASENAVIGLFRFEDLRGLDPDVAGKRRSLITMELPITRRVDLKADKDVQRFLVEALEVELRNRGFPVRSDGVYERVIEIEAFSEELVRLEVRADRVLLGRIHYLAWVEPGFAGAAVQPFMPSGKAYVDLDIVIIDPQSLEILWAGQAFRKVDSGVRAPLLPAERGEHLTHALSGAFESLFDLSDFRSALTGTLARH